MTPAFTRRYLKLLPHRLIKLISKHLIPTFIVFVLGFFTLIGISFIHLPTPQVSNSNTVPVAFSPPQSPLPQVTAKNIFIQEVTTGQVIYAESADTPIYPASTTKLVTALVVLSHFPLDQTITVRTTYPDGQSIGFKSGETISVENLLYALLVDSANDAAEIFAENYPGGRTEFVSAMNAYVAALGLRHTQFTNPTGLDELDHYSSASDLGRIAAHAVQNPLLSRIVSTENAIVSSTDQSQTYVIANTNALLGKVPGVMGIKTGFTDLAGQSLVTLVDRQSHKLIFVVMGSSDRFAETIKLIDWAYSGLPLSPSIPVSPPAHIP